MALPVGLEVLAAVEAVLTQLERKQEDQEIPLQHLPHKATTVLQTQHQETAVVVVGLLPQVQVLILAPELPTQLQGRL